MDANTKKRLFELFGTTDFKEIEEQLEKNKRVLQKLEDAIEDAEKAKENKSHFT